MVRTLAALLLAGVACGSATAPPIEPVSEHCFDGFCVAVPAGWNEEAADGEIRFVHVDGGSASISQIDPAFLVSSSGIEVEPDLEGVELAYWALLDTAGGRVEAVTTTPARSFSVGETDSGRRWHGLVPAAAPPAMVAITVSVPDAAWDEHGRTWVEGLRVP